MLAVAVAITVVVALAPRASAHALLLRTTPSPQTTVKTAPTVVRLFFSESVEVAFGAVRVFDVDGRRADSGGLSRRDQNREVDVATPGLRDGTYTVTWRVVSADGHPVHGGFGFYVGAPSSISAVAVGGDSGAGRTVGWAFGVVRFAWFMALMALVGVVTARRFVWTPSFRATGLAGSAPATALRRRSTRVLGGAWALLLVAGAANLAFEAATVSGLSLGRSLRPAVWSELLHTAYGHYWAASMVLTVALGVCVLALIRRNGLAGVAPNISIALGAVAVAGLCVTAALNGHARTVYRPGLAVPAVAIHLAAVLVWAGGLGGVVALAGWRRVDRDQRPGLARQVVARFGRLAAVSALAVVATGTVNAVIELASVSDLWRVNYGRVVLAKIVLVVIALALAARHRFVVPRRLADPATAEPAADSFARSAGVELAALVAAIAVAAGLMVLVPGRSLAQAANGAVNVEHRVGADVLQFYLDPSTVGANQIHLTYVNGQGLSDGAVAQMTVRLAPSTSGPIPIAMRLLSPGHFVGDANLAAPGTFRLMVDATGGLPATTFDFRIRQVAGSRPANVGP